MDMQLMWEETIMTPPRNNGRGGYCGPIGEEGKGGTSNGLTNCANRRKGCRKFG
jgi:hypothetical protein